MLADVSGKRSTKLLPQKGRSQMCAAPKNKLWKAKVNVKSHPAHERYKVEVCFNTDTSKPLVWRVKVSAVGYEYESIPECKQLPKLTAEVFDREDCPTWAKYAAVDECGSVRLFSDAPWLGASCWNWSRGEVTQLFGVKFDASDWQNSRIKRSEEEIKLPDWCKVGEWVYYFDEVDGYSYRKIDKIDGKYIYFYKKFDSSKPSDLYVSARVVYSVFIENTKQARLRPFNTKEMKDLVGLTVDSDCGTFLVTKFHPTAEGGKVCVDTICYDADELLDQFTIDGKHCGVLEHRNEKGVWLS